jgi:hypothetical protein
MRKLILSFLSMIIMFVFYAVINNVHMFHFVFDVYFNFFDCFFFFFLFIKIELISPTHLAVHLSFHLVYSGALSELVMVTLEQPIIYYVLDVFISCRSHVMKCSNRFKFSFFVLLFLFSMDEKRCFVRRRSC